MKDLDLLERLSEEIRKETPDVLGRILQECDETKGRELKVYEQTSGSVNETKTNPKKKKWIPALVGTAAAVVILAGGGLFGYGYLNNSVDSIVGIDVNPSIELKLNRNEKVLSADALNQDAELLLDGMDLKGTDMDVAVNALIGSMLKNGLFVDHPGSTHTSLHSAMFAIRFGVADAAEYPALVSVIRSGGMACSVYGAQFLLEACYRCGLADHALALMAGGGLRSWQNMLDKGATITMEAWDDSLKPNQDWNHAWGAAPANIIPRGLCGIRPLSPGFGMFDVNPQIASLSSVSLRQPTKHGPIELEIQNGRMELREHDVCVIRRETADSSV